MYYLNIEVINNGVGPAFIQDFTVHYEDSSYNLDLNPFAYQIIKPSTSQYDVSSSSLPKGYAIPSKRSILVQGSNNKETSDLLKGLFFGDDIEIEIVYSSVFDEQWKITSQSFVPEPID